MGETTGHVAAPAVAQALDGVQMRLAGVLVGRADGWQRWVVINANVLTASTHERPMIVVGGATGQLRRVIVQRLVERVPATEVGGSVRDPGRAHDPRALGVRVHHAFEGPTGC